MLYLSDLLHSEDVQILQLSLTTWMNLYVADKRVFPSEQLYSFSKYSEELSAVIINALMEVKMHVHSP